MENTGTRFSGDTWDLASSVGTTATMVAAARAMATDEAQPIISDPFAAPLVRAVGIDFFTKLIDGTLEPAVAAEAETAAGPMTAVMAVRTRFFDDFFLQAAAAGIRQAVILAAGLDSRAYRLGWAQGSTVYEIDQPEVIEFKTRTLADLGAQPTARRRTVAVDLRDDWPAALRDSGFDQTQPTAWSAEGLLIYLPPEAQDRLFDNITALSAPGSRLATEYHPDGAAALGDANQSLGQRFASQGLDLDIANLVYAGERHPVGAYLNERGWQVGERTREAVFAGYGRSFPDGDIVARMRNSVAIEAVRT
ncbi:SAM-dependent methyltransferase [Mycolicibacter minnesotensis]|uniref:S-adenosyl-L-methionine-dependent methyltransferase n=1 Tax=Mycolicibacter minnesotensis TaxID=1118379 RepID=A0A7I7R2U7_9MYCO|nr:class I SAM-dependent methyltransferase [Mycolicibacter minnesotensis]ORA99813.1 SAM-dependent methyltransferase [Mycolicibacter minnesotensis]BBY32951.1 putative S-adenosyl-L-methionine-dependent methyltransferase [Mycolicibacter minnesotensis]